MEDVPFPDSRACKLEGLTHLGFGYCPFFSISGTGLSKEYAEKFIQELVSTAANLHLPIDGIVMIFDSLSYSKSCGKTGHHYKDGLAYKFEDDTTKLSCVKLNGHRPDSERLLRSASSIPWRLTAVMFPELPFII